MSDIPTDRITPVHQTQQQTPRIPPQIADGDTMERLFQALFYRIAVIYARAIPKHVRRLGETAILVMAICCMGLLIYLHLVFNQKPVTCLSHLHNTWPREGVLRVELFLETPPENYNLQQSYIKEYQNNYVHNRNNNDEYLSSSKQSIINLPVATIYTKPKENPVVEESYANMSINFSLTSPIKRWKNLLINDSFTEVTNDSSAFVSSNQYDDDNDEHKDDSLFRSLHNYLLNADWLQQLLIEEQHILEYSLEYGFLRLRPETRQRLNIQVLLVTIAFYVILIVWISDQYESICCHTSISKRHWVRFFYIYHFAFYAYHARYNGQYSGLALTTSCCFIFHSMLYFFHHFELPVIEAQLVHILVDQNIVTQTTSTTETTETTTTTTTTTTTAEHRNNREETSTIIT
ncbi:unnamed protein product [Rotaria magnacalcarata]|uniref:Membralin n=1 Tax=Rotaria magnacalcarata TaxID=392030 RepID=A0A8S2JEC1_9BILA|nr:unnamed protein product [Rotaria magnacalcarata]